MPDLRTETDCPICRTGRQSLAHGVVAPFISILSSHPVGQETTLRICETCDLTFFGLRYGDRELESLYGKYRGPEYRAERHRWEPWYSSGVNDAYSSGSGVVDERLAFMMNVLTAAGLPRVDLRGGFWRRSGAILSPRPDAEAHRV